MKGYIYETTNLINNKKYIGKHICNTFDKNYYGSGVGLKRALNKYGKENFKIRILEKIDNLDIISQRETYYINKFDAVKNKNYYNNSYGGESEGWQGVNKMFKDNPEKWKNSRIKSSKSQTGQKRSDETKLKISKALTNKPKSKEHIKHLRESKQEFWNKASYELRHRIGLNFGTLGKPSIIKGQTVETSDIVKRARDNMVKTKNSEEWKQTKGLEARKKISNTRKTKGIAKGKNNPMYGTHTTYISNIELDIVKRIPVENLEEYLLKGWKNCNIHKMK